MIEPSGKGKRLAVGFRLVPVLPQGVTNGVVRCDTDGTAGPAMSASAGAEYSVPPWPLSPGTRPQRSDQSAVDVGFRFGVSKRPVDC
jgi:hypothetical protein